MGNDTAHIALDVKPALLPGLRDHYYLTFQSQVLQKMTTITNCIICACKLMHMLQDTQRAVKAGLLALDISAHKLTVPYCPKYVRMSSSDVFGSRPPTNTCLMGSGPRGLALFGSMFLPDNVCDSCANTCN